MRARAIFGAAIEGCVLLLVAVNCGGQTSDSADAASATPPKVPDDHRPTPVSCAAPSPSPEPSQVTMGIGYNCDKNEDCTAGAYGECVEDFEQGAHCIYQACTTDADCGNGKACSCGTNAGRSECAPAGCHVDSDCGTGSYCSPSKGVDCGKINGVYCHTASDACVNDEDCKEPGDTCSSQGTAWACVSPACAG